MGRAPGQTSAPSGPVFPCPPQGQTSRRGSSGQFISQLGEEKRGLLWLWRPSPADATRRLGEARGRPPAVCTWSQVCPAGSGRAQDGTNRGNKYCGLESRRLGRAVCRGLCGEEVSAGRWDRAGRGVGRLPPPRDRKCLAFGNVACPSGRGTGVGWPGPGAGGQGGGTGAPPLSLGRWVGQTRGVNGSSRDAFHTLRHHG